MQLGMIADAPDEVSHGNIIRIVVILRNEPDVASDTLNSDGGGEVAA